MRNFTTTSAEETPCGSHQGHFPSVSPRTLIADKGDSLIQCADFRNCLPTHDAAVSSGPLAVMQGRNLK